MEFQIDFHVTNVRKKMPISGWLEAKCKNCKCRFNWFINDSWPFVDSEIIGTCTNCIEEKDHDCIDELTLDADGDRMIIGRKEFKKGDKK